MLRYSIIMAAYNRAEELPNTLISIAQLYRNRDDFEVICAIDSKSDPDEITAMQEACMAGWGYRISYCVHKNPGWNSCLIYNHAAKLALGHYLVIQNPECMHVSDILGGYDAIHEEHSQSYDVAACLDVADIDVKWPRIECQKLEWYQHSEHNPRCLHFCTCLAKHHWDEIGGFSEEYKDGMWYEDNDFIMKVRKLGIPIVQKDDLLVLHQHHDKGHWANQELIEKNKQIYVRTWEG